MAASAPRAFTTSSHLFQPLKLGNGVTIKNRIIMAPMTRSRSSAITAIPPDFAADYYAARCGDHGAGLIITEGTAPCPNGLGYPRTPGIYSSEQVTGWKKTVDAVHRQGGKIFMQIMHCGRIAHTDNQPPGAEVLTPSSKHQPANTKMWSDKQMAMLPLTPGREMTVADIEQVVRDFAHATKNARDAGFDGVELHGANGYLINQFLHPKLNLRDDAHGQDKSRFLVEIVDAIRRTPGLEHYPVGVRLSPQNPFNDMPLCTMDEDAAQYSELAAKLAGKDLAYLHIVFSSKLPKPILEGIKKNFKGPVIGNGGYGDNLGAAETEIQNGEIDAVAIGSTLLTNPDLIEKALQNKELQPLLPHSFWASPGTKGYTDLALTAA